MHPASPHQHRSRLNPPGTVAGQTSLAPQQQQQQQQQQHTVQISSSTHPYQGLKTSENEEMGCVELLATAISVLIMVLTFPFSVFICFKVVSEYERAVIFRMGRLRSGGARGPGVFFVLPCVDDYYPVDLRTVSFDVPPQEVLSKDSVTVTVDAVVYYRISDPLKAVIQVSNYSHSTRLLAATTLRNVLGTRNLSELLTERETISHTMQMSLDEATDPWGVKVERVEIKDVSLPTALQRAMAAEAEAAREARAKVIAAEGEMKSSRALKEASEIISSSPSALQLRYLQTLSSISAEKNSTIIFPLPIELLTPFLNSSAQHAANLHATPSPLHRHQHQHHQ
ncbi:band 7 protein AGAP004871 [Drosophila mojavensis]|nr:band 7 protein AGAP004871 [Drosophila mojavensis]